MSETDNVTLVFEGILIGRYDEKGKIYEMGVLPAAGHTFSIKVIEESQHPTSGYKKIHFAKTADIDFKAKCISGEHTRWLLEIPGADPDADIYLEKQAPVTTEKPDEPVGSTKVPMLDYRWVLGLAGKKFPAHQEDGGETKAESMPEKKEVPHHDGLLKPIMVIKTGLFYARDLSRVPLHCRLLKEEVWDEIGYIPERIAANITLKVGKELVLKTEATKQDILRLKAEEGKKYRIIFRNAPPDEVASVSDVTQVDLNRPTHFQLSYLFLDLPPEKRYEVRYIPSRSRQSGKKLTNKMVEAELEELLKTDPATLTEDELTSLREAGLQPPSGERSRPIGVPSVRCSPTGFTSSNPLK